MGLEAHPPLHNFSSSSRCWEKTGDQRPGEPSHPPPHPLRGEGESQPLCPSGLQLWPPWLPHPSTDSSFLPRQLPSPPPLPLAPLQHNGLAAFRFRDTLPPGLPVLQGALSNTQAAILSHSPDTQCPTASHHPHSLQSQCTRSASCKLEPDSWEGGLEAAGGWRGCHSYLLQGEVSPQ